MTIYVYRKMLCLSLIAVLAYVLASVGFMPVFAQPESGLQVTAERLGDDGQLTDYRVTVHAGESAPPTVISIDVCRAATGYSRQALDPGKSVSWRVTVFQHGGQATLTCSYTGKSETLQLPGVGAGEEPSETDKELPAGELTVRYKVTSFTWPDPDCLMEELEGLYGGLPGMGEDVHERPDYVCGNPATCEVCSPHTWFLQEGNFYLDLTQDESGSYRVSGTIYINITSSKDIYWSSVEGNRIEFKAVNAHFEGTVGPDGTAGGTFKLFHAREWPDQVECGSCGIIGGGVWSTDTAQDWADTPPPLQPDDVVVKLLRPDAGALDNLAEYWPGVGLVNRMADLFGGFTFLGDIFGNRSPLDHAGQPVVPEALNSPSQPVMEANPEVDWAAEMDAAFSAAMQFVQTVTDPAVRLVEGAFNDLQESTAGLMLADLLNNPAPDAGLSLEERGLLQTEALMLALRQETDPFGFGPTPSQHMTREERLVERYNRRYAPQRDLHVNIFGTFSAEEWDQIASVGGSPHLVAHERHYAGSRPFYVDDFGYMSGEEWDALVAAGRSPVQIINRRMEMDRVINVVKGELGQQAIGLLEEKLGLDFEAAEALRRDLKELGADPGRAEEMVRATQMLRVIVHFGQDHTFSDPGAMEKIMRFVDSWCKRGQAMDTLSRHLHNNLRDLSERQLELIQLADREGLIEALRDTDEFVDESIMDLVLQYAEDQIKDQVNEKVKEGWWPW